MIAAGVYVGAAGACAAAQAVGGLNQRSEAVSEPPITLANHD